jgi:hypothetical protein
MNKPILFVLYISLACIVGFIGGVSFGGPHKKEIVLETLSQHNEVQTLMVWYGLIVDSKLEVETLERIKNMDDVESAILKTKKNGMSHVKLFNEQAEKMKRNAPNPEAILQLESSVKEMEKIFE